MNINILVMGILSLIVGVYAWKAWNAGPDTPEQHFLPFVPIDVRKTKVYVSQTRDAGMFIERARRTAIIGNRSGRFGYKGSDNGSLEAYLTGICYCPAPFVPPCPPAPDVIWDGGNAESEICSIVDGGNAESEYSVVDFGDATTNVCV